MKDNEKILKSKNIKIDNDIINNINYKKEEASFFLNNIKNQLLMVGRSAAKREHSFFLVDDKLLSNETQIIYEKNRIRLFFTHEYVETIDFVKYNRLREMIMKLSDLVDSGYYDYEAIRKIIVHIELELGMDVFFVTTLLDIAKSDIITQKYYKRLDAMTFEQLYGFYQESSSERKKLR